MLLLLIMIFGITSSTASHAEEGIRTYDDLPLDEIYQSKDDPVVKIFSDGIIIDVNAKSIGKETQVGNEFFCKRLLDQHPDVILDSGDPLVSKIAEAFPIIDKVKEKHLKYYLPKRDSLMRLVLAAISEIEGTKIYPDANSTLRFNYGKCDRYPDGISELYYKSTFYGILARWSANYKNDSSSLSEYFKKNKDDIDPNTPCHISTTLDGTWGSSGSPVVNKRCQIVGLLASVNLGAARSIYKYDISSSRLICVHPQFIIESLREIYDVRCRRPGRRTNWRIN